MCSHRRFGWSFIVLGSCLATGLTLLPAGSSQGNVPGSVQIGVVKTLFRDYPENLMSMLTIPLRNLMEAETGVKGQMVLIKDALDLGEKLDKNQVQLGVFHGFEFAWAQEKYPRLRPLMLAVNRQRYQRASLVIRNDSPIARFTDLKGKTLSLPQFSREHCWLFLERQCERLGCAPEKFFRHINRPTNIEEALDDVILGRVEGIIVDGVSLEGYQQIKPGCSRRLKVIHQSAIFPAAVIVYREGALDKETLHRFSNGMLHANTNPRSQAIMTLCKLTQFEAIPADYQQALINVRKAYPAPVLVPVHAEPPTAQAAKSQ
jgi:ABC-type phosphate/phosphonate transport system substrate-binding protein